MICIEEYMQKLVSYLKDEFGESLIYVGLQGSYLRGEATEESDADAMVVLKTLDRAAMDRYRSVLAKMGNDAQPCGFICAANDLKHWNPQECCQLVHSTKDIYGTLAPLLPAWTKKDAADYVKRSLNDFYHELCHRYIYRGPEHSAQKLPQMEKSLFFILQNLHYVETGVFCLRRRELLHALPERDQAVYLMLNGDSSFEEAFDALLKWCQDAMNRME